MTDEGRRKVTAPLPACAVCLPASPEQEGVRTGIRVCLCGGFCPQGLGERNADRNSCVHSGGALQLNGTRDPLSGLPVPLQGEPCSATAVRSLIQHLAIKANGITIYVPGLT